jgi:amino acid transporter
MVEPRGRAPGGVPHSSPLRGSALGDAIASALPSKSLASRSPLHGLRRGSVTTLDLVAQSVAAVAPAGVLLTAAGGLVHAMGSFAYVALVLSAGVVMLVALSISVFTRRIAAAGGIYTFVTRGLGPVVGIVAGVAIAIGYASVAIDTLRSAVRRIESLLEPVTGGASQTPGTGGSVLVIVVCTVLILVPVIWGARVSTRTMLVLEAVSVTAILALSVAVFVSGGWDLAPLIPDPRSLPSLSSFAAGIGVALVYFVGFESGAALGPESRRPLASVPRALVWTAAALGIVYLFGVAAQLSAAAGGVEGRTSYHISEATMQASPWIGPTVDAVIAMSWIACTLACTNALVRLLFTMARERVLPAWLGRTSRRFATPHRAALVAGAILAGGTILQVAGGRGSLLDDTIGLATSLAFVVAYLLVCAAAAPYLLRIGEFTLREAGPAIAGTGILVAITAVEVVGLGGEQLASLAILIAVLTVAAVVHAARLRAGGIAMARAGAYDTPVAADALTTAGEQRR